MFRGQLLPFTALIVALCGQGHGRAALLHDSAQVPGQAHTAARTTLLSGTLDALRHPRSSPARVLWRLRGGQQSNSTAPVGGGGGEWERWEAALNQRAGRRQGVGDLARVHGVPGPRGSLSSSAPPKKGGMPLDLLPKKESTLAACSAEKDKGEERSEDGG